MKEETIKAAAECRNAQDAMDILERETYYDVNHAPDYMVEYLDVCLKHLVGVSRGKFVEDWLMLIERKV